ncbi:MAG: recombinase family protein [Paludibacteraceae bacterium]|nr:recombinase family protein [Paludibacteraceae bacterium]
MKKVYGYIRLSPKEQSENNYSTKLAEAGVPESLIYTDKISNTNSDCAAFKRLVKKLNPGDLLFVTGLNQLGKNCDEVKEHWRIVTKDCNCDLVVLDTPVLDTRLGETIKDVVIEAFDAFSKIKRNYARQRQAEGIAVARVNDVTFGRRSMPIPKEYDAVAGMYGNDLISAREAARRLNVSVSTFLKWYRGGSVSTQSTNSERT